MMNVIGLGYIGLPKTLIMASHGIEVISTDYNKKFMEILNEDRTTFKKVMKACKRPSRCYRTFRQTCTHGHHSTSCS